VLNPVARPDVVFVKFREGTDRAAGFKALRRAVRGHGAAVFGDDPSNELHEAVVLERVDNLPLIVAGLLALFGTAVLLHLLVTSVRSRRADLAVLVSLGFRRRDLRAVIAWQATTVAVIALIVGLPLGAVLGGRAWELYAGTIGVLPEGAVPVIGMAIAMAGGVLLTNIVARWPAGVAARTRAAQALRAE
jgi:predicted lysophospholipase L1 biosynthesis ABC-type transport system permease subunit